MPRRCAMLWEVEIHPTGADPELGRVGAEFALLTHQPPEDALLARTSRGYLLEGNLPPDQVKRLSSELLIDPLVETGEEKPLEKTNGAIAPQRQVLTVLRKPGVMDPVA